MRQRKSSLSLCAVAVGALLAASGTPALGTAHVRSTVVPTPVLKIVMSKGTPMTVVGSRKFSAGRLDLTLHAKKGEQEIAVMRLHQGYTIAKLKRDFATYGQSQDKPTPAAMKALNRIVRRTTFYGGLDSGTGHTTLSGSVVLPKAGTYHLLDDSSGPGQGGQVTLHVTAKTGSRTAPAVSAHVRAVTAKRFRGSSQLPASGTIQFMNAATNSPHFLDLQHVKKGTTRKDVIKALQGGPGSSGPNPFLDGTLGTDVVFPGKTQTLSYTLPAGYYALMCFFPDLKTGMPHAFMGMVRIVHLS